MAGRYNTWLRNKLADRIEGHGEYCACRHAWFPLEWNVPFYASINSDLEVVELMVEYGHVENEADFNLRFPDFAWSDSFGQDAWGFAQERLVDDLTNDEGLSMWSPDTAKKYGFDYVGDGADRPFRTKLENYGRGGKHVVISEFEGITLRGHRADSLAGSIWKENEDLQVSNKWCRQLMGMLDEWDGIFTQKNATDVGRYYMADFIARDLGFFD